MKKNAIGHMGAAKQPVSEKIRHWRILPKLLCLLLALVIWLAIDQIRSAEQDSAPTEVQTDGIDS